LLIHATQVSVGLAKFFEYAINTAARRKSFAGQCLSHERSNAR
jgi:hypothetical protein